MMIPLLVCASLIFLLSKNALSWSDTAHGSMTEAASSLLSKMLNDKFDKKYLAKLPLNVLEPDENRVIEHTDLYQCASMINTLADKAERLLHKNEDWSKIMFLMAEATHYIEDLNNPIVRSMTTITMKTLKIPQFLDIGLTEITMVFNT